MPPQPEKLYLNRPHSASVLAGQADVYVLHPPASAGAILIRLRRDRYGDPLLMGGGAPPRVPRRCRVKRSGAGSSDMVAARSLTREAVHTD